MGALALTLSFASLLLTFSTLIEPKSGRTVFFVWTKFLSNAWAPHLAVAGALGALLGIASGSPVAAVTGLLSFAISAEYVRRVARRPAGFDRAFGAGWRGLIPTDAERHMLRRRWGFFAPRAPEARVTRDLPFAVVPATNRELRCDLWQPAEGTAPSGAAIVYLHGSAWTLLDKDMGTRRFFRHLAAQGHVVMDVAYRLCPETDFVGMVADAKRAVAWMKEHAAEYGARAEEVVLMGASAGAHVALLAAYTPGHPRLTPTDLRTADTTVRAVVSYYGIPDMRDYDVSARRFLPPGSPPPAEPKPPLKGFALRMNRWMFGPALKLENLPPPPNHRELMGELLGGLPLDLPDVADLASPLHHVTSASPPIMHLQGRHDQIAPIASARRLQRALEEAGVPAVFVEYPATGHAFDLLVPPLVAPTGQAALYDVERFLACVAAAPRRVSIAEARAA